jgi:hypothetical protein
MSALAQSTNLSDSTGTFCSDSDTGSSDNNKVDITAADYETRMNFALEDMNSNVGASYTAVANKYNVRRTTLRSRHTGKHKSVRQSHVHLQKLNPAQEEVLVLWANSQTEMDKSWDYNSLRFGAQKILRSETPPGKMWVKRFLKRHPTVSKKRSTGLDPERAPGFNKQSVTDYFNQLEQYITDFKLQWQNIYNMDEKGLVLGAHRKGNTNTYIFERSQRSTYRLKSGDIQIVTIIECIAADGTAAHTGFVSPKKEDIRRECWYDAESGKPSGVDL